VADEKPNTQSGGAPTHGHTITLNTTNTAFNYWWIGGPEEPEKRDHYGRTLLWFIPLLEELVVALAPLIPISGQMETSSGSPRRALLGGHYFKESTLTALNWMVTHHHFHPGPGGNDKASEAGCPTTSTKATWNLARCKKAGFESQLLAADSTEAFKVEQPAP
jgi:hypothetical protein